MERLTLRAVAVGGFLLVAGLSANYALSHTSSHRDEKWMEQNSIDQIPTYQTLVSNDNPSQSYRMDDKTYALLKPFGIVCRVFQHQQSGYDVVLIAGNDKESFHDPRVCFTGQGWNITSEVLRTVHTQTRGDIPISLVRLDGPDQKGKLAAYFYHAKAGFYPRTGNMGIAMFLGPLKGDFNTDSVFYRFMPVGAVQDEDALIKFIGDYMDRSKVKSNGFF